MKNQNRRINKAQGEPVDLFAGTSYDAINGDIIGEKVLYNWLYQKEEENYYTASKEDGPLPDFSEDVALFVEYA